MEAGASLNAYQGMRHFLQGRLKILVKSRCAVVVFSMVAMLGAGTQMQFAYAESELVKSEISTKTGSIKPSYVRAKVLKGRVLKKSDKKGMSEISVQLLDAGGIVMDVVTTDKDGNYNLDLGVLEDSELAALPTFSVEVTTKSKKVRKKLGTGLTLNIDVLSYKDILIP